jgi:hypothetical protein
VVKVFSKRALPAWGMHATASLRADLEPPRYAPWGLLAAIDLHGCDRELLEDPELIRRFVTTLVDAIEMRAHGPVLLERFGDGELEGWSALQVLCYPIYYCLVNGALALLIHVRRTALGAGPALAGGPA